MTNSKMTDAGRQKISARMMKAVILDEDHSRQYASIDEFADSIGINRNSASRIIRSNSNNMLLLYRRYGFFTARFLDDEHLAAENLKRIAEAKQELESLANERKRDPRIVVLHETTGRTVFANASRVAEEYDVTREAIRQMLLNGNRSKRLGILEIYRLDGSTPKKTSREVTIVKSDGIVTSPFASEYEASDMYSVSVATLRKWIEQAKAGTLNQNLLGAKYGISDVYYTDEGPTEK